MLSCSIWYSVPIFGVGGGLEGLCVRRVYVAGGARHHPCLVKRPNAFPNILTFSNVRVAYGTKNPIQYHVLPEKSYQRRE